MLISKVLNTGLPLLSVGVGVFLILKSPSLNSTLGLSGIFLLGLGIITYCCPYTFLQKCQRNTITMFILGLGIIYALTLALFYHGKDQKKGKPFLTRILYFISALYAFYLIGSSHWSFSKVNVFLGILLLFYSFLLAHLPFTFKLPSQHTMLWIAFGVIIITLCLSEFVNYRFKLQPTSCPDKAH